MVVRNAITALATMLLMASLLWGQCASCQQALTPSTGCCNPSGKCSTPGPAAPSHQHCASATVVLDQYVKAEPAQPATLVRVEAALAAAPATAAPVLLTLPAEESPPELYLLNSAFRI